FSKYAATLQSFFRAEEKVNRKTYSHEEKASLIESVLERSTRECERVLRTISPQAMPVEKIRPISGTDTSVQFVAHENFMKKLERVRELAAHRLKTSSHAELLELALDLALQKLEPRPPKTDMRSNLITASAPKLAPSARKLSRYIPIETKRRVWVLASGRCEYIDHASGRRCEARRFLQVDHVRPFALGGGGEVSNLRLLCRAHNLFRARLTFIGFGRGFLEIGRAHV